jgi:predicted transcriptional regulator
MKRYNKLKIRTLNVFAFAPEAWFRPREVAERLDFVPRRAAWSYLKRLWRFKLLERIALSGRLKYRITEKGMARLRWLR